MDAENVDVAVAPTNVGTDSALLMIGATHMVQIVEVEVRVTIEMVFVTSSKV